jgi:hypothetical protein
MCHAANKNLNALAHIASTIAGSGCWEQESFFNEKYFDWEMFYYASVNQFVYGISDKKI